MWIGCKDFPGCPSWSYFRQVSMKNENHICCGVFTVFFVGFIVGFGGFTVFFACCVVPLFCNLKQFS